MVDAPLDSAVAALDAAPLRVAVIGNGLAGLVAARELARPGFAVTVAPAHHKATRRVESVETGDDEAERMPDPPLEFTVREGALARIIREVGLEKRVEHPLAVEHGIETSGGRVVPMPKSTLLGIPASPLATDVSAVVGSRGSWRAFLDRIRPVLTIGQQHNLATLVRQRMGARVLQGLVAPAARARFGVAPERLDVAWAVPGLNPALTRAGSLSGAVTALLGEPSDETAGLVGGLPALCEALAVDAARRGATLFTSLAASVRRRQTSPANEPNEPNVVWQLVFENGEALEVDVIVAALDDPAALAELVNLQSVDTDLNALEYSELVDVQARISVDAAAREPRFGAVLAATGTLDEASGTLAEASLESQRWPSLAAEAQGDAILRARVVASGAVDNESALRVLSEASTLLGLTQRGEQPADVSVSRERRIASGAVAGQHARIKRVREAIERAGLVVTGAWISSPAAAVDAATVDAAAIADHAAGVAERVRLAHWGERVDGKA